MSLSVNQFTYAGDDEFDLNFVQGYSSRKDVTCYKVGEPQEDLFFDWLTDNRVRLENGHELNVGDIIVFRRTVSKTVIPYDLTVAGEATRENIQNALMHNLYILHELFDNRTDDVHPWGIIGEGKTLQALVELDYMALYENGKVS